MGIGGLVFTPARLTVSLFFIPALLVLFKSGRNWISPDFFAITTAGWIMLAALLNGGYQAYVGAEALEFIGAYFIGRASLFRSPRPRALYSRF